MHRPSKRVSVVRIPRHHLNHNDSNEIHDEPEKKPVPAQFQSVDPPRPAKLGTEDKHTPDPPSSISDVHRPSPTPTLASVGHQLTRQSSNTLQANQSGNDTLMSVRRGPAKSSATIQSQPRHTETWVRPSFVNRARPHLSWEGKNGWNYGLCSAFDDFNMCCYACMCWCCFRHELSSMMNEHWCIWFINCWPLMQLRTKFRTQYAIEGSIVEDCCVTTCCPLCVALQLAHEGREHGHRIFT